MEVAGSEVRSRDDELINSPDRLGLGTRFLGSCRTWPSDQSSKTYEVGKRT